VGHDGGRWLVHAVHVPGDASVGAASHWQIQAVTQQQVPLVLLGRDFGRIYGPEVLERLSNLAEDLARSNAEAEHYAAEEKY
jgi:hypothetical protein